MVKNFESKGLVHPEQKEKKNCVWKNLERKESKKKRGKGGKRKKFFVGLFTRHSSQGAQKL